MRISEEEFERLVATRKLPILQSLPVAAVEAAVNPIRKRRSKYNSVITEVDGIKFHSKKEARYYQDLKARVHLGEVLFFLRQVPIGLPGNTKYVVDFVEFLPNGKTVFIDVKGRRTPTFILLKKQVEALYPIKIIEA